MKKGLELFKFNQEDVKNEIDKLSNLIGQQLPVELEIFLTYYVLGQDGMLNAKREFEGVDLNITSIQFDVSKYNISYRLSHFFSLQVLLSIWEEEINSECFKLNQVLPIGKTEVRNDWLYISVNQNKGYGSIWLDVPNKKFRCDIYEISRDIFDFCSKLYESDISDIDYRGKKVYKIWGEKYWKV